MTALRTIAAALALCAASLPGSASAQTKADAFAGRIPPVSGQLFQKAGRFELTPTFNLSLNDAFFTKYFGGLKLGYHFTESASAAIYASSGPAVKSGSATLCSSASGCADATDTDLRQVPGRIRAIIGAEGAWSPVYGKLNVLSEMVGHFDLSILAGPDLIAYDEVLSTAQAVALAASGGSPTKKTALGGHVGFGARVWLAQWFALRLEVKDYVYALKVPNNGAGNDIQNQLFTELGFSFFLPTRNRQIR